MTNEDFIKSVSLEGEIWKDVVGYEGLYLVSNFGRIVSLPRPINTPKGGKVSKLRILTPRLNSGGYYQVAFCINKTFKQPHIHKVVAEAFIPNPNNYPQVDHIDCDKLNNKVDNLRWCTQSMNNNNPITKKRKIQSLNKPVVRISMNSPNDIKIYKSREETRKDGFIPSAVGQTCSGKHPHHKGFKWVDFSDYEKSINKSKNATIVQLTLYPQSDEF